MLPTTWDPAPLQQLQPHSVTPDIEVVACAGVLSVKLLVWCGP